MKKYEPPFEITNEILQYATSITEKLGSVNSFHSLSKQPVLRKQNRIKSIKSSCAIEANSLTFNQVHDLINGQKVIGPKRDIIEVQNAIEAYNEAFNKDPFSEIDLKFIHSVLTKDVIETSGKYRNGGEGVVDNYGNVIFLAPPGKMVPELMSNLLIWVKENFETINTLILSSIFHYEFVFIHPFEDGNGRTARLWQNLILSKWKPIFEYIPIESLIEKYQTEYYEAIAKSNENGNCTVFIAFMLKMIDLSLNDLIYETSMLVNNISIYTKKLLNVLIKNKWYSSNEMQKLLKLSDRGNFRKNYLEPAIKAGLIEIQYPDKPSSRVQRYRKI